MRRLGLVAVLLVALVAPAQAGKPVKRTRVQLANFGEDPHDLRLHRVGGTKTFALGEVQPGDSADLRTTLSTGRYVLWCSIADHRALGMQAQLVVKKKRR